MADEDGFDKRLAEGAGPTGDEDGFIAEHGFSHHCVVHLFSLAGMI